MKKFHEEATAHGEAFMPVIFETLGYWHKTTARIVKSVCTHISQKINPSIPKSVLVSYWTRRISTAVTRAVSASLISKGEESYIRNDNFDEEYLSSTNIFHHIVNVSI